MVGAQGDPKTIPVDSMICASARQGFVPPLPIDRNQDNNDILETHVNSAPTFLHSVGSSAAPTTAGFAGDVLPCAPCFTQNGIAHSKDVLQNQYLMTCAILPPGFNPPQAIAKQHEKTHRDVLPLNPGNQHALDTRASYGRSRIYFSPELVTLRDDLSHALSELTADAMSGDANVYPTGIPGVPDRSSEHDTSGDNVSWQPVGEREAHVATTRPRRASNDDNTLRDRAQLGPRSCLPNGITMFLAPSRGKMS